MTSGVNHITLAVSDLRHSLDFCVHVLGCEKAAVWRRGAYLRAGQTWLCLALDPTVSASRTNDDTHVAFTFDPPGLAAFRTRLVAAGGVEWKANSSEGDSVYFLDPDGHRLEAHVGDLGTRLASLEEMPYEGLEVFGSGARQKAPSEAAPERRGATRPPAEQRSAGRAATKGGDL